MGCLKTIPVPTFFPSLPFRCHSRAGGPSCGRSLPLQGCPGPSSSELPRETCMSPAPAVPAHSLWTSACCQDGSPGPPLSLPLALTAGTGFSFWKLRGEVSVPSLHHHSGPIESSLSQVAPTPDDARRRGMPRDSCSGLLWEVAGGMAYPMQSQPHWTVAAKDRRCSSPQLLILPVTAQFLPKTTAVCPVG